MAQPHPDWARRLRTLVDYCSEHQLDAFVVSTPNNLTYLTGFRGTAGLLVVAPSESVLIVDGRYAAIARRVVADGGMAPVRVEAVEKRYELTLGAALAGLRAERAGFEAEHLTVAALSIWKRAAEKINWVATEGIVEAARVKKDDFEIAIFRRAARALSDVAREMRQLVTVGRTEIELARSIDAAIDRAGFSEPAFPTIVASGPNSAYPHARPTERRMAAGDLVLLDFGGVLDGYCVDLTRMAAIGQVPSRAVELYEAVRAAQSAAVSAVKAGTKAAAVDAAAREVLASRGLGEAFLHGTGHGLGLDVHEAPRISRADAGVADVLEARMICTIEPGAYVEGLGGVRLEDDVLVTAEGCELLTDAPRDLVVV